MSQLGLFGDPAPVLEVVDAPAPAPARPHLDRDELARRILDCHLDHKTPEYEWLLNQLATKDVPRPPKDKP